ncbi:MAG: hypothetical protein ABJE10_23045 [bacterium]
MIDYRNNDANDGYDFGDEADVQLPSDPQFDAWIVKAAPQLNTPPATPHADMWDAIQATQRATAAAQHGEVAGVTPLRRTRWRIPAALAAALLLGIAIDRIVTTESTRAADSPPIRVAANPSAVAPPATTTGRASNPSTARAPRPRASSVPSVRNDAPDASRLYHLAAVQTLTQAEALLTAYRASAAADRDPEAAKQLGMWGRQVLSSTRLLLDSPAGDDPATRSLLNDLELVLVQIIHLSGAPLDASERALIDDALRNRDLLPRIRTAVPAGVAGTASD